MSLPATLDVAPPRNAGSLRDRVRLRPAELLGSDAFAAGWVTVTAAWWLGVVARAWGGRDAHVVGVGAALLAVAVVLVRPDRVLPRRLSWSLAAGSVAAMAVPLLAPSGWRGAAAGAGYACGFWVVAVVAAVVRRRPPLAPTLVLAVAVAAAVEFAEAWLPWWGGENPAEPIIGTFYWHDPFAAFVLPGALLGMWLWAVERRLPAALGLMASTLGAVGMVYSTSRAASACLLLGVAGSLLATAVARCWRTAARMLVAAAVATAATVLVAGPPFFPTHVSAVAAVQARTQGQSLTQNGAYRLEFWREAWAVFTHHPVTGGGYHSLVAQSAGHVPHGWALSPYAHSATLQALADGGLLLAVPLVGLCLLVALLALRALGRSLWRRQVGLRETALPLTALLVLLHANVDWEWTFPAAFALFCVLAGLLIGAEVREPAPAGPDRGRRVLPVLPVLAAGVLAVAGWSAWSGDHDVNLRQQPAGAGVKAAAIHVDTPNADHWASTTRDEQ